MSSVAIYQAETIEWCASAQIWYFDTVNGGFGRIDEMQLLERELEGANFSKTMIRLAGGARGAPPRCQPGRCADLGAGDRGDRREDAERGPRRAWPDARGARRHRERCLQRRDQQARICNSDRGWDAGAGPGAQVSAHRAHPNRRVSTKVRRSANLRLSLARSRISCHVPRAWDEALRRECLAVSFHE